MTSEKLKRRMRENEAVFRRQNESVVKDFTELRAMAADEGQIDRLDGLDNPILFFCECADEGCNKRVKLRPSMYADIHKKRDHFIILPGHQVPTIEHVIKTEPAYAIVKKYDKPKGDSKELQPTDINNS